MATLSDIRTDVRAHVDEAVQAYWQNDDLDRWIYEAARDVARNTHSLQDVQSYNIEANRDTYDLPLDFLGAHRVEFRTSSNSVVALDQIQIQDYELSGVWYLGGLRSGYAIWGTPGIDGAQLRLIPTPTSAYSDGLRLFYYRLPHKPLKDDSLVEIPAGWEDLIALYVEAHALRRSGSPRWQIANDLYTQRLQQMGDMTARWSNQMVTMSDLFSTWEH